jgi:pimeloyl-ACP methyl ester carboxylesterase
MKKRVLYLHGLESSNVCDKVDFLREVADCYAPPIDYKDPYIEDLLLKMIRAFKPEVIIGSSMGGYAALLLGNYFGISTVAFNPAFHSRSFDPNFNKMTDADPSLGFTPVVVLGMEDDVINPLITKEILDDAFIECVIEEVEGMGHRIPLIDFEHIYNKYIK